MESSNEQKRLCRKNLSNQICNQNIEVSDFDTSEKNRTLAQTQIFKKLKAKFKKKKIISQKLAKAEFNLIGDSDSNDDSEYNASYFNDDGFLSKSTVSFVLGHDIPMSGFFTEELDKVSNVNLEDNIFDQLYQQRSKRWFKRGTWQSNFVKDLKKIKSILCL